MAETLLKIENLTKEYEGQKILDGIHLEVKKGDVLVVVGPSGCGKSTLLRCINALEPIQGGTIKLQGMDIRKGSKNITTLRQKIGMVFQSYELFPHLTVIDNITLAPVKVQKRDKTEVRKEAMELLARVGLADKAKSYPRQLSGGQKQRVAIVRALCMHPEILLFDEVTAALDPEMVREVLDVMLDLVAIAQSSPGAIAVNGAIVVGYKLAGIPGTLVAILGTILPPFVIISVISICYNVFRSNFFVAQMLSGMQAGVGAVIASVTYDMGAPIVKEKDPMSLVILLGAFLAACILEINVIYIVIVCGLLGVARTLLAKRRAGK